MEGDAAAEAEAAVARIRVVRCPKCDKFLPELPVFSIYVCGGCGATLQAKKNSNNSSQESDGRNVKYLEVLECVSEASETMLDASTADRSETNKTADIRSKSVYSHHENTQKGATATNLHASVRDEGREVKYRHFRNWENREVGRSLRVRDISPRPPIDFIPPSAHSKLRNRYSNREHLDERAFDGPSRVRGLEKDRAEILRMLDELRNQVKQSCDVTDEPSRSDPASQAVDAPNSYVNCDRLSHLSHDAPQLNRNGSLHSPSLNVQSPSIPHAYAPLPARQDFPGYAETIAQSRASSHHATAALYPWRNFDNYFFGQHDHDPLFPCRHDGFCTQGGCSCLHCCHREFLPVQGNPLGVNEHRVPYFTNGYSTYPVPSPLFGQQRNRSRSRGVDSTLQRNNLRANVSKKTPQTCDPIAGGAPFTICYNCCEVLQFPKIESLSEKEYKLRCGSCSHAIVVKLDGSRLNVSEPALSAHVSAGQQNCIGNSMRTNERDTPDERAVPAYCFSVVSHESQEKDLHSNLSESENNRSPHESQSEDTSESRDLHPEANVVSRVPSLPHHDHYGFSPSDDSAVGSRSTHSEPEKVVLLTESFKQSSVRDVCVANEMQSPVNESHDPECTKHPVNTPHDAGRTRVAKAGDSFLTNLIKKSFKRNNGTRNGRAKVFVNGFPLSDRTVRKAEKLAGAIHPGDYWYDYRAGFWGVMGHPCLGMIPPYIPEFNYPMPKNCAGGNTGVFVNGRELHQKDLDLLVARGLSDSPGRSYLVESSGKVSDEGTGEELNGLGKLAPTVEKMRRGFGMRVPRFIHQ